MPHISEIKKSDDELQIIWAEVYAPDIPDSQGDFMTPIEIQKMSYNFMLSGALEAVDVNHDNNNQYGNTIIESFIARKDDSVFIPDAWVVGIYVPNPIIWQMIKDGELNGLSMEALVKKEPKTLIVEIPAVITGKTTETEEHTHKFEVGFDDDGKFLGGRTLKADDGHYHMIAKGTVTEDTDGHSHRFQVMEEFNSVAA